jgi:3-deoxy-7-phosphoheptulonate synthase
MAKAAVAAGADGLMVEVHPDPKNAKSDQQQQMTPDQFMNFMKTINKVDKCVNG